MVAKILKVSDDREASFHRAPRPVLYYTWKKKIGLEFGYKNGRWGSKFAVLKAYIETMEELIALPSSNSIKSGEYGWKKTVRCSTYDTSQDAKHWPQDEGKWHGYTENKLEDRA